MDGHHRVGVAAVWIVDLDRRCCEVSGGDGRRLVPEYDIVRWHPAGMVHPLELRLERIFRDIV